LSKFQQHTQTQQLMQMQQLMSLQQWIKLDQLWKVLLEESCLLEIISRTHCWSLDKSSGKIVCVRNARFSYMKFNTRVSFKSSAITHPVTKVCIPEDWNLQFLISVLIPSMNEDTALCKDWACCSSAY
jgi:hypothetical protein